MYITYKNFIRVALIFFVVFPQLLFATDYTSTSYTVKDPVLAPAGYSTSSNYSLTSTIGQFSIGTSTASAGSVRETRAGFEYYPFVTIPVLSGTAGAAQASLSWTASTGALGWTVSGYSVGQGVTSGGPYSFTALGLVTNTTVLSLTNGTTYYFVIRVLDGLGNVIATSNEISVVPAGVTPPTPTPTPSSPNAPGGGVFVIPVRPPIVIPPLDLTPPKPESCNSIADLNCDGYVDIVDFSIMYHWYDRDDVPSRVDLAPDGVIDISDFSVMAYYWYEKGDY